MEKHAGCGGISVIPAVQRWREKDLEFTASQAKL
jgi:hypothetical protein